jgi:hypothetical protein
MEVISHLKNSRTAGIINEQLALRNASWGENLPHTVRIE